METELKQMILDQQKKIDEIYVSVEKTRKYLYWTMVTTIIFFVLPLLILAIAVPTLISTYTTTLNGLGL